MTLIRTSEFFPSLMDRFFNGELADWNSSNYSSGNSTLPAINVLENENEFMIDVAAPGLRKEDFKINLNNGQLTISSEQNDEKTEEKKGKYTRREYSYQSFQRSFTLSNNLVDADKIKASYSDGILHVSLPKKEEVKRKPARTITIS